MKRLPGTMHQKAIGLSLVVGLIAGSVWLARDHDGDGQGMDRMAKGAESEAPANRAELSHLTAQMDIVRARGTSLANDVARLQEELTELGEAGGARGGAGGNQTPPSTGGDEARTLTPEEAEARADDLLLAQLQLFEDRLLEDGSDATWAPAAVETLHRAFRKDELASVHLDHAECGTSFCRLEVSFDSAEDGDKGLRIALQDMPWRSEGFVHMSGGVTPEALVYVAREGHMLPRAALD